MTKAEKLVLKVEEILFIDEIRRRRREPRPGQRASRADNRSRKTPKGVEAPKLDKEQFAQRKRVINIIRQAQKIDKGLPRVKVRMVNKTPDNKDSAALAIAFISQDSIFIDLEKAVNLSDDELMYVVMHELIHAVYGGGHVKSPKDLMNPIINYGQSKSWVLKQFQKWYDRYNSGRIDYKGFTDEKGKYIKFAGR